MEFSETDMAGIVHFSNYFRFMEATEHAFFRSLGISLHHQSDGRMLGWARVHASCEYLRPACYQNLIEIHLTVSDKTANSLSYSFVFRLVDEDEDEPGEREIARGDLEVVCVTRGPGEERIRATDMPEEVARLVEVAPRED